MALLAGKRYICYPKPQILPQRTSVLQEQIDMNFVSPDYVLTCHLMRVLLDQSSLLPFSFLPCHLPKINNFV